ncbi:unnamed protein product [Victoria cruziana]
MSCNGCRVLRKGCSDNCILRPCLQWIETPEAQGHATVFVAKFFGRAGLMSFISAVPESQRPALFQSLLYEAAGRTVNPVNGAVGLLWSGNWHLCQGAVETVLRGGALKPLPEIPLGFPVKLQSSAADDVSEASISLNKRCVAPARVKEEEEHLWRRSEGLDLCLNSYYRSGLRPEKRRAPSPSLNSEGSVTSQESDNQLLVPARKILNLFV